MRRHRETAKTQRHKDTKRTFTGIYRMHRMTGENRPSLNPVYPVHPCELSLRVFVSLCLCGFCRAEGSAVLRQVRLVAAWRVRVLQPVLVLRLPQEACVPIREEGIEAALMPEVYGSPCGAGLGGHFLIPVIVA